MRPCCSNLANVSAIDMPSDHPHDERMFFRFALAAFLMFTNPALAIMVLN